MSQLTASWRVWLAENLLRGAAAEDLVATLAGAGVEAAVTHEAIAELQAHPAYEAGRRQAALVRRLRFMASARRTLNRRHPIPRLAGVSPERFYADFYRQNRPVVLTDLMARWPALARWSPSYLRERYGHATVRITSGREADPDFLRHLPKLTTETTMAAYAAMVEAATEPTNDFYMIAVNRNFESDALRGLHDDVRPLPPMLREGAGPAGSYFWFGPRGTLTPLHHDQANILFCQVLGRKKFYLIDAAELAPLEHSNGFVCDFDCERPDFEAYPGFRELAIHELVLEPGEALLIPVGWWHQVRALDLGMSVTFTTFTEPNDFEGAFDTLNRSPLTY